MSILIFWFEWFESEFNKNIKNGYVDWLSPLCMIFLAFVIQFCDYFRFIFNRIFKEL